jgi:hypothetical protein
VQPLGQVPGRVRWPGGERWLALESDPTLLVDLDGLVEPPASGDPMPGASMDLEERCHEMVLVTNRICIVLLSAPALWTVGLSGCGRRPDLESHIVNVRTGTMQGRIRYGVQQGKLCCVVFQMAPIGDKVATDLAPIVGSRRLRGVRTISRDEAGNVVMGRTSAQVCEYQNGVFEESELCIDLEQLVEYLDSRPAEYSVRALAEFVGQR